MIEVSLYSIPENSDVNVTMGRCIDRTRFDKNAMNTGVMEFVKGFLKTNMQSLEPAIKNPGVVSFINDDQTMTTKDFASINYWLAKVGYVVKIQNVTEDEENPTGVPSESAEWNIIDFNFMQEDYPTAIKVIPSAGTDVVSVLKQACEQVGLFDEAKIGGIKNPLKELVDNLVKVKDNMGKIEPGIAGKIYDTLEQVGIKLFLAVGE